MCRLGDLLARKTNEICGTRGSRLNALTQLSDEMEESVNAEYDQEINQELLHTIPMSIPESSLTSKHRLLRD